MSTTPAKGCKVLTDADVKQFLERGWIKVEGAIPPENVDLYLNNVWTRTGYDPADKSTWKQERVHLPRQREIPTKEFCPKAYWAICDLVGGEDRLDDTLFSKSGDSLILNFGRDDLNADSPRIHPKDLDNWHCDGDWFQKRLDASEQALVVLHMYTDLVHDGGATYICEDGLNNVIRYLYKHPEGAPMRINKADDPFDIQKCERFTELTGKAGDVILAHPFMLHSASQNYLRRFRAITNPPATLKEPLNFNRSDGDYSLVERKILQELGQDSLPEWKSTNPNLRWPPATQPGKIARILTELDAMLTEAEKNGTKVDSMWLRGEKPQQWKLNEWASEQWPPMELPVIPDDMKERAERLAVL